ncbi:MAG: hypothetical protein CEE43_11970 [Promethearchaeota archaeon Loki_b32]|nr:MAG: hypothetical protein CEE43_11970 [Candidatus Lokiarchaeota archaeon Loki_b32]
MRKLKLISDKFTLKILTGVFGLLSITFGIIGDIIAYLMYPGYDFRREVVSSLCKGPGGLFFQSGTVISGLFAFIFVIYLVRTFDGDEINENLRKFAKIMAIVSCASFIMLGVFCGSNPIVAYIHGTSAMISWISGLLYITLYNIFFIRSSNYSKFLGYFGFIETVILVSMLIFFFLHLLPALSFLMKILPNLEWLNTLSLISWYLVVSIYIIHKKN